MTTTFVIAGCSGGARADEGLAPERAEGVAPSALLPSNGALLSTGDPAGTYFADVNANGSGCPAGSWVSDISPDGQTFTVTFTKYETTIAPNQFIDVKDCQLAVRVHTPQGLSFSVGSFDYSGFASLDSAGMTGTQTATYYFQGDRLDSSKGKTVISGVYDGEYTYRDVIGVPDLVWSPCGAIRNLNIATRIILKNNPSLSGHGYLNTSSVDGQLKLVFKLNWASC